MKNSLILFLIVFISYCARGQQKKVYTEKDYARSPLWIGMIKDTTTNFFEAEKAFKIYFRHHEQPGGEHDIIGEHSKQEKNPSKKELRKLQADDHMRMEVKKYERWRQRMQPFVQDDGSILTPSQRLELWRNNKSK